MKASRLESETVVLWNDAEKDAIINTRSQTTVRRLSRKGYIFSETPLNSGLWRTTAPKARCYPRPAVGRRQNPSRSMPVRKKTKLTE